MSLVTLTTALHSGKLDHVKQDFHDYFLEAERELHAVLQDIESGKSIDAIDGSIRDFALLSYWAESDQHSLPKDVRDFLKLLQKHGFLPTKSLLSGLAHVIEKLSTDPYVATDGTIWGTKPFEQINVGWVFAPLNELLTAIHGKAEFANPSDPHPVDASFSMAILGDWGSGFEKNGYALPARNVLLSAQARNPTFMVHLGDVYYTGQPPESVHWYLPITDHPSEAARFVDIWPDVPSFALNSNHEMYCGAWGYRHTALGSSKFATQKQCNYFALQNEHWLIIGFDSAYDAVKMYQDGRLTQTQIHWAQHVVAGAGDRKIFVMTHHQGLSFEGTETNELWDQVVVALNGRAPDYWYWGHIHNGVVYGAKETTAADGSTVMAHARLCGHGAIPFGKATFSDAASIEYFAHTPTDNADFPKTVRNGYAVVKFDGPNIVEEFWEEDGADGVRMWCSDS